MFYLTQSLVFAGGTDERVGETGGWIKGKKRQEKRVLYCLWKNIYREGKYVKDVRREREEKSAILIHTQHLALPLRTSMLSHSLTHKALFLHCL